MSAQPHCPLALVVTADDFGIGVETSRGIIDAHLRGPVTATSLMVVTGDHVRASIPLLQDAPDLEVGLHLVLTRCGEKPLVATRASGLVDRDGQFFTNGQLWKRALLRPRTLDRTAIADEIVAQTERFAALLGRPPAYVDSHHHSHQVPAVRNVLATLMRQGILPSITRVTRESGSLKKVPSMRAKRSVANLMGRSAARQFRSSAIWTNDSFFGMLGRGDLTRAFPWDRYLPALPQTGAVEWIVHPGRPDPTLAGRDGYQHERATEWQALTAVTQAMQWQHLRPILARKSVLARG